MTMPADRLTTLEIRAMEQERTIEELSGQIAAQWAEIDRLGKALLSVSDRFASLEDRMTPETPSTRPPHY